MSPSEDFLRPADLARLLGVTRSRIYQLLSSGELPSVRIGGAIRVPRVAWERWVASISERALAGVQTEK
jgi:excisionase family DNA binding protein